VECICPCKRKFEKKRPNQVYFSDECRKKDKNRRWPVKRQSLSPALPSDALKSAERRCTPGVTPDRGESVAQTQGERQFSPNGENVLVELRAIDEIIRRERLLTAREVAAILGVSVSTLHGWRGKWYRRDLKYVKLAGARVRYRLRDLVDWLNKLGVEVPSVAQGAKQ
jgi:predicted DNA-binding transcriptional regulator AlpA